MAQTVFHWTNSKGNPEVLNLGAYPHRSQAAVRGYLQAILDATDPATGYAKIEHEALSRRLGMCDEWVGQNTHRYVENGLIERIGSRRSAVVTLRITGKGKGSFRAAGLWPNPLHLDNLDGTTNVTVSDLTEPIETQGPSRVERGTSLLAALCNEIEEILTLPMIATCDHEERIKALEDENRNLRAFKEEVLRLTARPM
jgi:hypothetical protein